MRNDIRLITFIVKLMYMLVNNKWRQGEPDTDRCYIKERNIIF